MKSVKENLLKNDIILNEPAAPVANYVGYNIVGNVLYISGQLPLENGNLKYKGKLGQDFDISQGQQAARLCAINMLAQINSAWEGNLEKVEKITTLNIFINSTDDFIEQAQVANGASDLIANIFGEKGKHTRAAVSSNSLPLGCAVEVAAIVQLKI